MGDVTVLAGGIIPEVDRLSWKTWESREYSDQAPSTQDIIDFIRESMP